MERAGCEGFELEGFRREAASLRRMASEVGSVVRVAGWGTFQKDMPSLALHRTRLTAEAMWKANDEIG